MMTSAPLDNATDREPVLGSRGGACPLWRADGRSSSPRSHTALPTGRVLDSKLQPDLGF